MSWDVSIHAPPCERSLVAADLLEEYGFPDEAEVLRQHAQSGESVDCGGYTWNVSAMFDMAFGGVDRFGNDWNGRKCSDVIPSLVEALEHMDDENNYPEYAALNPSNGWGNFDGARSFLRGIYEACKLHPEGTLRVC
jgi:hypothetical protein